MSALDNLLGYAFDFDFSDPKNTGFLEDIYGAFTDKNGDIDYSKLIGAVGGIAGFVDSKNTQQQPVGYQGKIPEYNYKPQQITGRDDTNRVPGSAGRQYFTDTPFTYTNTEENAAAVDAARGGAQDGTAVPVGGVNGVGSGNRDQQLRLYAEGGLATLKEGKYLQGGSDGMADEVPASINDNQEARLSDGEFVMPADIVSHLGNGNSDAGAKVLYDMMDKIRKARTGKSSQGKQIDPNKMMPRGVK